jgi:hypothetical protein
MKKMQDKFWDSFAVLGSAYLFTRTNWSMKGLISGSRSFTAFQAVFQSAPI